MESSSKQHGKPLQSLDLKTGDTVRVTWTTYLFLNMQPGAEFEVVWHENFNKDGGAFLIKLPHDRVMLPMPERCLFEKVESKNEHTTRTI